jgi:acyl phosphate:glycerol-3-phosphate acyltransferase
MLTAEHFVILTIAYLVGSIPTAVWIGKIFYRIDVREYGSGNAGATNTFRVLGKKAGIPVLIIDVLKGWGSVKLAYFVESYLPGSEAFINFQLALAIAALVGHIFPIYVGFRGGKGIATLLGIGISIHIYAALICITIFIILLIITRYVSLSSIISGIAFPFIIFFLFKNTVPSLNIFAVSVAVMVVVTHQKNIERLLKGEESKTYLFKKKTN